MIVIVGASGGRDYELFEDDKHVFRALLTYLKPSEFWHGGARGVDATCGQLAAELGFKVRVMAAPWNELDPVGDIRFRSNDAGPLRNWWMARECRLAGGGAWIFFLGGVGSAAPT